MNFIQVNIFAIKYFASVLVMWRKGCSVNLNCAFHKTHSSTAMASFARPTERKVLLPPPPQTVLIIIKLHAWLHHQSAPLLLFLFSFFPFYLKITDISGVVVFVGLQQGAVGILFMCTLLPHWSVALSVRSTLVEDGQEYSHRSLEF